MYTDINEWLDQQLKNSAELAKMEPVDWDEDTETEADDDAFYMGDVR